MEGVSEPQRMGRASEGVVRASDGAVSPLEWVVTGPDGVMSDSEYREVLKRGGSGWKRSSKGSSQEMRKRV